MKCPRCGASGFSGVCNECGFPVTKVKMIKFIGFPFTTSF